MRAETFFRDHDKTPVAKKEISLIAFNFYLKSSLFTFICDKNHRSADPAVFKDGSSYIMTVGPIFAEDTFNDVRQKILDTLEFGQRQLKEIRDLSQRMDIKQEFSSKVLFVIGQDERKQSERIIKEFDRVGKHFNSYAAQIFRIEASRHNTNINFGYDCFSIYKHADNSTEWRSCKVT